MITAIVHKNVTINKIIESWIDYDQECLYTDTSMETHMQFDKMLMYIHGAKFQSMHDLLLTIKNHMFQYNRIVTYGIMQDSYYLIVDKVATDLHIYFNRVRASIEMEREKNVQSN